MTGRWTVHTKVGRLLLEDIYDGGLLLSAKTYDRNGRLREWLDYSIATEEEPYKCYVQKCSWLFGDETVTEYIICKLDGVIAPYFANYVRQLESRAPSGSE